MSLSSSAQKILSELALFLLSLILSLGIPYVIEERISNVFTSTPNTVQNSGEPLSQLQSNVERMKGLQTQFGLFTDFLRFNHKIDPNTVVRFTTDNDYINKGLPNRTGIADLSQCIPQIPDSLPIEKLQDQIDLVKHNLSEDCIKKVMGVQDTFVKTHFENLSGTFFIIFPDQISVMLIYLFSFAFWNALLLLTLNVYKNILGIRKDVSEIFN